MVVCFKSKWNNVHSWSGLRIAINQIKQIILSLRFLVWFPGMQVFREGINTPLTPLNTLFLDAIHLGQWRRVFAPMMKSFWKTMLKWSVKWLYSSKEQWRKQEGLC